MQPQPRYQPSPAEIRRECERLRQEWDDRKYQERGAGKRVPWRLPLVTLRDMDEGVLTILEEDAEP